MAYLIDIGKPIITTNQGFHIQSHFGKNNHLTLLLLQDYFDEVSQYRIDCTSVVYYELVDESISSPKFHHMSGNDSDIFKGVVFEVLDSHLVESFSKEFGIERQIYHYFIRTSLYYIEFLSYDRLLLSEVMLDKNDSYQL